MDGLAEKGRKKERETRGKEREQREKERRKEECCLAGGEKKLMHARPHEGVCTLDLRREEEKRGVGTMKTV